MVETEPRRRTGSDGAIPRKMAEAAVQRADSQARGFVCPTASEAEQELSAEEFQERIAAQRRAYGLSRTIDEKDIEQEQHTG